MQYAIICGLYTDLELAHVQDVRCDVDTIYFREHFDIYVLEQVERVLCACDTRKQVGIPTSTSVPNVTWSCERGWVLDSDRSFSC